MKETRNYRGVMTESIKKCDNMSRMDVQLEILTVLEAQNITCGLVDDAVICNDVDPKTVKEILSKKNNTEIDYSILKLICNFIRQKNNTLIVFNDLTN